MPYITCFVANKLICATLCACCANNVHSCVPMVHYGAYDWLLLKGVLMGDYHAIMPANERIDVPLIGCDMRYIACNACMTAAIAYDLWPIISCLGDDMCSC